MYGDCEGCIMDDHTKFDNGLCKGGKYNIEARKFGNSDCYICNAKTDEKRLDSYKIGNGICDGKEYTLVDACSFDGGDCTTLGNGDVLVLATTFANDYDLPLSFMLGKSLSVMLGYYDDLLLAVTFWYNDGSSLAVILGEVDGSEIAFALGFNDGSSLIMTLGYDDSLSLWVTLGNDDGSSLATTFRKVDGLALSVTLGCDDCYNYIWETNHIKKETVLEGRRFKWLSRRYNW